MIRFLLKELLAKREFQENRRITLNEVAEATKIHRVTLSKLSNERGYNAGIENVDRLCEFFNCQPGGLDGIHSWLVNTRASRFTRSEKAGRPKTVPEPSQAGQALKATGWLFANIYSQFQRAVMVGATLPKHY